MLDAGGRLITPGLIDCHTHIVHAGNRAAEIERRLAGESYQSIARAGGGILSTVTATRAASLQQLIDGALPRVDALLAEGVTTLEVKSGYGLDLQTELRMLEAARALGAQRALSVTTTYLGAHAVPPEHAGNARGYVDRLCTELIPAVAASKLADAFDAYCEQMAFTAALVARTFVAARAHGLPVKLHADQLSNMHGAALAAQHGALSADHLEYTDADGVAAMAAAGTVAVLLPGAYYFLRERQRPPVETCCARRSADGGGDRLQSGHLAAHVDPDGHEFRRRGIRTQHRRMPGGRHARGGACAGAALDAGHDRDRQVV